MNNAIGRRPFGKQGDKLSIIGMGGIVIQDMEQEDANRYVAAAVERGVNYFDVAPSYGHGMAETRLGPALEPYRKQSFLACKTGKRDATGAEEEIAGSFERLRTDYFDLFQLHAITDVEKDVDAAFASGGVMEMIDRYKREGRIRHVGFSAHSTEAALAAMGRYDFDSILVPLNFAAWFDDAFGPQMLEAAEEHDMSVLALKALARHKWPPNDPLRREYGKCWYRPVTDPYEAKLALRFTLSLPVSAAIPPGEAACFDMAMDLAAEFEPITPEETATLKNLVESFKTDPIFTG